MILQDTIYNTKIVYLYINKFEYGKDQIGKEQSSGHPKPNTVYRAIYNTDTHSYRIIYKVDKNGIHSVFIGELQVNDVNEMNFVCDVSVLSVENILDFKISESNLDDLIGWLKTDNKDVKDLLGDIGSKKPVKTATNTGKNVKTNIPEGGIQLPPQLVQFITLGSELMSTDPLIFGTVFDLLIYLNDVAYVDTGVVGTGWLKLDKEHGAGVNVSAAIDKLSKYLGTDRRVNLDNNDLMGAIKDLLTEKSRRNYHDI